MKSSTDWREEAVNAALRAAAEYGDSADALLLQIRLHDSALQTMSLWPDRPAFQIFLDERAASVRSLLANTHRYAKDDKTSPYIGWLGCVWQGETIEIVFAPAEYEEGKTICVSPSEAALADFARAWSDYEERPHGRCLRYSEGWENAPDLDRDIGGASWDDVILAPKVLGEVRGAVENFFAHREAFVSLGFTWRRGLLLIGPPGTGKTLICKAAAASLPELPFLYVRDLREYHDNEAIKAIFKRARKLAPCLLIFEDLESLIGDQWRSQFLNELDGFESNEGIFVIASSNHPGKIDTALLKRPSRFDRVVHIGLPAIAERARYCARVLEKLSERLAPDFDVATQSAVFAEKSKGFTLAYLKEGITAATLQMAQEGVVVFDERFAEAVVAQIEGLRQHLKRMKDPEALAEMTTGEDIVGFRR